MTIIEEDVPSGLNPFTRSLSVVISLINRPLVPKIYSVEKVSHQYSRENGTLCMRTVLELPWITSHAKAKQYLVSYNVSINNFIRALPIRDRHLKDSKEYFQSSDRSVLELRLNYKVKEQYSPIDLAHNGVAGDFIYCNVNAAHTIGDLEILVFKSIGRSTADTSFLLATCFGSGGGI